MKFQNFNLLRSNHEKNVFNQSEDEWKFIILRVFIVF